MGGKPQLLGRAMVQLLHCMHVTLVPAPAHITTLSMQHLSQIVAGVLTPDGLVKSGGIWWFMSA